MKRLFLLLVALFVVATLQAQVMCYEYEYSHSYTTTYKSGKPKYKYSVEPHLQGKKLYWAIHMGSRSPLSIYPAAPDGEYWTPNLLKPNSKTTFTRNNVV